MTARPRGASAAGLLLLSAACASIPAARSASGPPVAAWAIPPADLGTQRLFRMSYSGPRGEGSFRLTLRLLSAERYQAQAVDPVGRALWSLDADGERGLFLDHRAHAACDLPGELRIAGAPLERIALSALPRLLLGRAPAEPASPPSIQGGAIEFGGAPGEFWRVVEERGRPVRWTLLRAGVPAVWWRRKEAEAILSDRSGAQLRWREAVSEPLAAGLAPLETPADYARGGCPALTLGSPGSPREPGSSHPRGPAFDSSAPRL
ncbi:MAG TPA: hypothetical protein VN783_12290 [Thermoanaerobaculia bacterium]|nr:hypothetical protein [Thermoanaerobaculia bacterium]